jgi:hypothetical protein
MSAFQSMHLEIRALFSVKVGAQEIGVLNGGRATEGNWDHMIVGGPSVPTPDARSRIYCW